MRQRAARVNCDQALYRIGRRFDSSLRTSFHGQASVTLSNDIDSSRPPLRFEFIKHSVLGNDVYALDPDTILGCGNVSNGAGKTRCNPHMGQNIGCEYGRLCECLEDAAVEDSRLTEEEKILFARGETATLPKRFPYHNPFAPSKAGCLVPFYLKARHAIYECNFRCNCGARCKTRVVQHGRQVPLEIFKTKERGWGRFMLPFTSLH